MKIPSLFRKEKTWFEKNFNWIVAAGITLTMGLSLIIGLMQSVWFDEGYSLMVAERPVGELVYLASVDTHPPLYYLLLKLWTGLFGWSELAIRSLSILAMGGAALIGVLFVRRYFGIKAALSTLGLVVLAPFLIRYGFEIRAYALASLIGIAATYILARAVETKEPRKQLGMYVLYAFLVAIGLYTLYYLAVLWIAHLMWLIWLSKSRGEAVFRQKWWLSYLGAAVLFLPWIPSFLNQLGSGALAPISEQLTVENIVGIVSFWFLYQSGEQLNGFWSLIIVMVIAALIYLAVKAFQSVSEKQKPYLLLLGLYTTVPIVLVALISLLKPLYVERYLAHVLIGAVLFTGVAVAVIKQRKPVAAMSIIAFLGVALLCGVYQLAQVGNYNFQRSQVPHIREVADALDCKRQPLVITEGPYEMIELNYYVKDKGCDVRFFSEQESFMGGYAPLSSSPKRITDISQVPSETFTYVYYDSPKQDLPATVQTVRDETFSAIHVHELRVR